MFKRSVDASTNPSFFRDIILLTLVLGALFGALLGSRVLSVPDEGRYAEIPREMVATGDYVTPRLDGVKYFEKPALFYWLEAASIRLFGLNTWSLRLWPALFALAGCLMAYTAGRRLFSRRAGLLSAGVLATSLLYYALGRTIILDMPVTVLLSGALLSFLLGALEEDGKKSRWYFRSFFAFAALAVMTKGLIGLVFPGMIIFAWMLVMNEWRVLKRMRLVSGFVIFLVIAAPWHVLAARANPEFLRFYFIHEHFERYLTKVHGRYKPFWYFIPVLAAGFFPWVAFLAQSVWRGLPRSWSERGRYKAELFLLLWAALIFLFFSASDSKLPPYILPVIPPLALLVGRYLSGTDPDPRGLRFARWTLLALGVLFSLGLIVLPRYLDANVPAETVTSGLVVLAVAAFGTCAGAWFAGRKHGVMPVANLLFAGSALFLTLANPVFSALDTRPVKDLAGIIQERIRPGDEVMNYGNYYQDLPVYLEHRVTVVNWTGELDFGTTVEDTSGWIVGEAEFQKRWRGPGTIYLLTDLATYDKVLRLTTSPLYPLARSRRTILLCNKENNNP